MTQSILLFLLLIAINAVFASAEIAVISMNEAHLAQLTEEGDARAIRLSALTEQPAKFLATIQVAITMAGFLQGATAASEFSDILVEYLIERGLRLPVNVLEPLCLVAITLLLAYFNLVLGELVPKRVAMKKTEGLALGLSGLLGVVSKVFAPLVWLLSVSTNLVLRLMHIDPEEEDTVSEEEIRMLLMEGNRKGVIRPEASEIIQNVFEFDDCPVKELCTHRREITGLYQEDDDEEWRETIYESRHSFYPIFGESKDDILGLLDTKDYFRLSDQSRQSLMKHAVDKPWFVPENMKANVLFRQMRERRSYFAVLLDEYGGLSGIITLHDLVEMLVGDLSDIEEEEAPDDIEARGENEWRVLGSADLDEVGEELGCELPTDRYDTFNGYVCGIIGRVPEDGETFSCEDRGLRIRVIRSEAHRVAEAIVSREKIREEERDEA